MRKALRRVLLVLFALVIFLAVPIAYSTLKGYTHWHWRNYHVRILVNGLPANGYMHRSNSVITLTRRDTSGSHSYMVFIKDTKGYILDCGDWVASSFFVFGINHVHPLCICEILDESAHHAPDVQGSPMTVRSGSLEFHTQNGKRIKVEY